RAATAVRDAKRLVQIEVAHVGPIVARSSEPDLSIEIGTVEINLPAERVHNLADRAAVLLEHATGRAIADHNRGKLTGMLLCLAAQVGEIDVSLRIAGDDNHVHSGHMGGSRVRAMGGRRDETDVAVAFPVAAVIGANGEEACVFSL